MATTTRTRRVSRKDADDAVAMLDRQNAQDEIARDPDAFALSPEAQAIVDLGKDERAAVRQSLADAGERAKAKQSADRNAKADQDRARASTASRGTTSASKRTSTSKPKASAPQVDRVAPSEIIGLLEMHGASRKAFAEAMGVTVSRVSEWTTPRRPRSHMARSRWLEAVKAAKAAAKASK